jgi:hypothetical protein
MGFKRVTREKIMKYKRPVEGRDAPWRKVGRLENWQVHDLKIKITAFVGEHMIQLSAVKGYGLPISSFMRFLIKIIIYLCSLHSILLERQEAVCLGRSLYMSSRYVIYHSASTCTGLSISSQPGWVTFYLMPGINRPIYTILHSGKNGWETW